MGDQDQDTSSDEKSESGSRTDVTIDVPSGPPTSLLLEGRGNASPDPLTAKSLAKIFSWGFLAFILLIVGGVIYLEAETDEETTQKLLQDIFSQLLPVWTGFLGMILGYYFRNKDP